MRLPSNEGEIHTNNMQCENAEDNFDENEDDDRSENDEENFDNDVNYIENGHIEFNFDAEIDIMLEYDN